MGILDRVFKVSGGSTPGDMEFTPNAIVSQFTGRFAHQVHPLQQSAVDKIVSRTACAKFYCDGDNGNGTAITDVVMRPNKRQSPEEFYGALTREMLTYGIAYLFWAGEGKGWCVAASNKSAIHEGLGRDGEVSVEIAINKYGDTINYEIGSDEFIVIPWRPQEGNVYYNPVSPVRDLEDAFTLYDSAGKMLWDFAVNANKTNNILKTAPNIKDNKTMQRVGQEVSKQIKGAKAGYATTMMPPEGELVSLPEKKTPDAAAMDRALEYVCRYYGIPMELMARTEKRSESGLADGHLIRDAVNPALEAVAAAWTRKFCGDGKMQVKWDPKSVISPSIGGFDGMLVAAARSGCFTINEIREMQGYGPLETGAGAGDKLPVVTGTATRDAAKNDKDMKEEA